VVEARKKAQQWMEYDKIDAEKIGRTVKITKHTKQTEKKKKKKKKKKKEQYREILKQIQGNPAKQKINKGNKI
jgi:hypothetical protein